MSAERDNEGHAINDDSLDAALGRAETIGWLCTSLTAARVLSRAHAHQYLILLFAALAVLSHTAAALPLSHAIQVVRTHTWSYLRSSRRSALPLRHCALTLSHSICVRRLGAVALPSPQSVELHAPLESSASAEGTKNSGVLMILSNGKNVIIGLKTAQINTKKRSQIQCKSVQYKYRC